LHRDPDAAGEPGEILKASLILLIWVRWWLLLRKIGALGRVTIQKLVTALHLKGEDARNFIIAGLKLSSRDRVLPEVSG